MMTPKKAAFVIVSASSRGALPSKEPFPFAQQDWIEEQQNLIRKPLLDQHQCQREPGPKVTMDLVPGLVTLNGAFWRESRAAKLLKDGRHEETRTPDLYRVKVAL